MDSIVWSNSTRKLSELIPWEKNPRQIKNDQGKRLVASLRKFGYSQLIEIEPDNTILDGHQRDFLMKTMNEFTADTVLDVRVSSRKFTEKERQEYIVLKHKGATGEFNFDVLANDFEFSDLLEWGFDEKELLGLDFDNETPEDPGAQVDRAEELREKWQVEMGQLWKFGKHRLICGDCTDGATVARLMGNEKADLIYTDPPYGYDKEIDGDENIEVALGIYSGALNNDVLKDDAWAIVDTPKKYISEFINATEAHGWKTREPVLHMYRNSMANGVYGTNIFELSFVYSRGNPKVNHRHLNGVDIARKAGHDNLHPLQKFTESYEHYLEMFSTPASIVVDYFVGSGTTLVACERLGRLGRGIEISPAYVAVSLQRLADMGLEPVLVE